MLVYKSTAFRLAKYHNIYKRNKVGEAKWEKKKTMMRIRSRKGREKSFSIDTLFTYEVHISERVEGINFS